MSSCILKRLNSQLRNFRDVEIVCAIDGNARTWRAISKYSCFSWSYVHFKRVLRLRKEIFDKGRIFILFVIVEGKNLPELLCTRNGSLFWKRANMGLSKMAAQPGKSKMAAQVTTLSRAILGALGKYYCFKLIEKKNITKTEVFLTALVDNYSHSPELMSGSRTAFSLLSQSTTTINKSNLTEVFLQNHYVILRELKPKNEWN